MPHTIDKYKDLTSSNYDWSKSRENYSSNELLQIIGWIDKQQTLAAHEEIDEDNVSFVSSIYRQVVSSIYRQVELKVPGQW